MKFVLNKDGRVPFLMIAGDDVVSHDMALERVEQLCREGKKTASTRFEGYPVCVDNKFFFAAVSEPAPKKKKA